MIIKDKAPTRRDVFNFTMHYWRPKKWFGIGAAGLMIASVMMDAIIPIYTGRIIDAMTQVERTGLEAVWQAFIGFTVIAFMHIFLRFLSLYLWNIFSVDNVYRVAVESMQKLQRFSADWHANSFVGGSIRKVTRGMWSFDKFEDAWLRNLLPAFTIMIGMTAMLAIQIPIIGLVAGILIILFCSFSIWLSLKFLAPGFKDVAEMDTKLGATLADIITGNPTVKSFGAEKREDRFFRTVADIWYGKVIKVWQISVGADLVRSTFRIFMNSGMIALAIFLWKTGKVTPGDIVLVITSFFIITGYLRDIGSMIAQTQKSANDMADVVYFWLREDDVIDHPNAKALTVPSSPPKDIIVFDNVSFRYNVSDRLIYNDFSVKIKAGEKIALVGPSGSGKSTFVKLVQRLYNVTSGEIRVFGEDISKVTMESLRQSISLVPQDPILFHRSLYENIAYARPDASREEIITASKKAYAHDFIMSLPKGYDTLVGERGIKLSGGERQRVAIARAILSDTPILILDEATSSLDSVSEDYIQRALVELVKGRTTITIAHRLSTIQRVDRILVFDEGRIIEEGSHQELMRKPNSHYKKLYDLQVLGFQQQEDVEAA